MKGLRSLYLFSLLAAFLSACACNPTPKKRSYVPVTQHEWQDKQGMLETIFSIADEYGMKVISDLYTSGGGLYGTGDPQMLAAESGLKAEAYYQAFGGHDSFWGWYVNTEINPVLESDTERSRFWRLFWKGLADKCHALDPDSKVTISPFFIMDKDMYRGFAYTEPETYAAWWAKSLQESGIDILMLQDSGAEHLSFFTLEDREPFFKAFSEALTAVGKQFWVNVESAQVQCKDWPEAMEMERTQTKDWQYCGTPWLKEKLELAAKYGTDIVNWGYYPIMYPLEKHSGLAPRDVDLQSVDLTQTNANYASYKSYYEGLAETVPAGMKCLPKINGTLWYLVPNSLGMDSAQLKNALRREIRAQRNAGMEYLWINNVYGSFTVIR